MHWTVPTELGNMATISARLHGTLDAAPPHTHVGLLLATHSYPYQYGIGSAMESDWNSEDCVASIVEFVILPLRRQGCVVSVFVAVQDPDSLELLYGELQKHGVDVADTASDAAGHFVLRCQAACRSLRLVGGDYDFLLLLRPDLLFDRPIAPLSAWSRREIMCRARKFVGPQRPLDADVLSWWDESSYEHVPETDAPFTPDDQIFIVPAACAEAFTRAPTEHELSLMHEAAHGATYGFENQMRALMRSRAVGLRCVGLPCVLLKHAALKALYVETGRAVSQGPRMVYRERPPDDDCGNVMF